MLRNCVRIPSARPVSGRRLRLGFRRRGVAVTATRIRIWDLVANAPREEKDAVMGILRRCDTGIPDAPPQFVYPHKVLFVREN